MTDIDFDEVDRAVKLSARITAKKLQRWLMKIARFLYCA